ncbi:hypothetical protein [Paenibacillus harenae]|uniref:hypothetical protein n=1 Tax=Paenibacillus harenae TaxID=306543 RepID=UPI000402DBD3|nr:hypothetical protein [Paenibacillus harenae]
MKLKGMLGIGLAPLLIAGAVVYQTSIGSASDRLPVAEVNGSPVSAPEFGRELERQRASVVDYFHRTHGAEYGNGFWKADYDGENPEETAKEMALEKLVKVKAELELAKREGLIAGTSYDDLLREMEKENKRRQAAIEANQPIYGPGRMDESSFINYYMSNLRIRLKEKLAEDELKVTDEELKRHYELVKDTLFAGEDRIKFQKLSIPYKQDEFGNGTVDQRKQAAEERLSAVKLLLDEGMEPEEAALQVEDDGEAPLIRYTEEEFNAETAGTYFKSQPALYSILEDRLQAGQVTPAFHEAAQGEYVLIKITEREAAGHIGFEGNESVVWTSYMEDAYAAYLNKLIEEAVVTVHQDEWDKVKLQ